MLINKKAVKNAIKNRLGADIRISRNFFPALDRMIDANIQAAMERHRKGKKTITKDSLF